jgi:glycosyltransferase involved in cell wall biosynthesis
VKLLQLMAGAAEGGAENFFTRFTLAMEKTDIEQTVLMRANPGRERILSAAGVKIITAVFGGRLDIATRRAAGRVIDSTGPDIVLSWMNRATGFVPKAKVGRNFIHVGTPRGYYDPKYYSQCDHLVVTTEDLARFYTDAGWPPARITAIANFVPDRQADPVARDVYDTPSDAPLLLALGRLHENKGFDVLLDALSDLPGHYLWIGGVGPLEQALRARAEQNRVADRVRFLGWVADTAPLFAAADVFVCSSRHEPFGNIVIEAWVQSVPLVAAASEGPSMLVEDGENGLLVPVEDGPGLARAIRDLTGDTDKARAIGATGRRSYEAGFTEEKIVSQYCALFQELTV